MNKYQEALNNIKKEAGIPYFSSLYDIDDWKEDFKTLQELINKETPMKPPLKWEYAKPQTRCKCGAGVEKYHTYCWNCGQKLDWSDNNV